MTWTDVSTFAGERNPRFLVILRWHVRCTGRVDNHHGQPTQAIAALHGTSCSGAHPGPQGVDGPAIARGICGRSARQRNPGALEARASLRKRGAEVDVALGRVL